MKKLSNYDKQLINVCYGGIKQYKQLKKDQRNNELFNIALDERIKENSLTNPRLESQKLEIENKKILELKNSIRQEINKNNPFTYKQFLIVWDIFNNDYNQILGDLEREKINNEDVKKVVNYLECYPISIISDYWKYELLKEV